MGDGGGTKEWGTAGFKRSEGINRKSREDLHRDGEKGVYSKDV